MILPNRDNLGDDTLRRIDEVLKDEERVDRVEESLAQQRPKLPEFGIWLAPMPRSVTCLAGGRAPRQRVDERWGKNAEQPTRARAQTFHRRNCPWPHRDCAASRDTSRA